MEKAQKWQERPGVLSVADASAATRLGRGYAEARHTEAELLAETIHICQEHGWTRESGEAAAFDFLAGAAYWGRWRELHPEPGV